MRFWPRSAWRASDTLRAYGLPAGVPIGSELLDGRETRGGGDVGEVGGSGEADGAGVGAAAVAESSEEGAGTVAVELLTEVLRLCEVQIG